MAKKLTQAEQNPFPFSDTNKRYHTYDYYMKRRFGGKCVKLPIDAGFTCPNIDGRCGTGGCIYCSGRGSGDFAPAATLSIGEQIKMQKEIYARKWDVSRSIAYFQAHTNTYAELSVLKEKFEAALAEEQVIGLHVATRADCLEADVVEYLSELAKRTYLCVELGLQSSNDQTAALINRGHSYRQFVEGFQRLRNASSHIRIGVHIIFGLPEEGDEEMLATVRDVAALAPDEVKIHLLHVLRGTVLADMYESGAYIPLERERYVRLVADAIELLPPETVIARLTGDGMGESLLAPLWNVKKTTVINDIDKLLYARNSWQGKKYQA